MNVLPSPWTNWAKTSWPNVVVPNHHSESGGTPSGPTKAFGSPGRRKGAASARISITARTADEMRTFRLRRTK
jgi:hypothetical protein